MKNFIFPVVTCWLVSIDIIIRNVIYPTIKFHWSAYAYFSLWVGLTLFLFGGVFWVFYMCAAPKEGPP